jgi:hypothetical protein
MKTPYVTSIEKLGRAEGLSGCGAVGGGVFRGVPSIARG